jgi:mono/diheme cytochrome c family protein
MALDRSGRLKWTVDVVRRPFAIAVSPDGRWAAVSNLLPAGRATDPKHAASVSLIDTEKGKRIPDVRLPAGSSNVRGLRVTPDGKRAIVVHTLGRTQLPTTQLERGWVNTNAMSFIDRASGKLEGTVLLDNIQKGAADPWGIAIGKDRIFVTLSGTHELAVIDSGRISPVMKENPVNDLAALHRDGLMRRIELPGKGPRGVAVSPDGGKVAVALYFSGTVALMDVSSGKISEIPIGDQPEMDDRRLGEMTFHDATQAFQQWLSCASCHAEGRADGHNWDLLNDGIGNPKNALSLVWSHKTPPVMSRGVRDRMETAAAAGFRFIQFCEIDPKRLEATVAYLRSLEPEPSPWRAPDGGLTESARRGQRIFEDREVGCGPCHPGPLYTDLKQYDVGTRGRLDRADEFDTPTLVELWRTAPYLHDGRAASLMEVLKECNRGDRHGKTSHLTEEQLRDLVEFLRSL